jgi:small subunit ribosomal protein S4
VRDRAAASPGGSRGRIKQSEHCSSCAKQKARRYCGVLESPHLLREGGPAGRHHRRTCCACWARLDNVVYRLGFAASRAQARQLVRHGHFAVNGRRVNIPSYQVKPDDIITVRTGSSAEQTVRDATDLTASVAPWLQADHDGLTGKILKWPDRGEIDTPVQESLIVELYSK